MNPEVNLHPGVVILNIDGSRTVAGREGLRLSLEPKSPAEVHHLIDRGGNSVAIAGFEGQVMEVRGENVRFTKYGSGAEIFAVGLYSNS